LLGTSASYEFDDAPRDQTENKPLQPIFRVRPEHITSYVRDLKPRGMRDVLYETQLD
jgi:hypothetical protein